ncbi:alpha/beta hydrolase-fold protein [uncultured Nonlabens sp.]|uniref:alpha/beta hydrolase-fold protein n=1 Tax=uncultured Nonlabens sp. TaxID=859306 RepID=UPI0030DC1C7F|tara:strand:+ start:56043 stop:57293 length:1251 start_codon:yes stop_codon:yes gene_type:complete
MNQTQLLVAIGMSFLLQQFTNGQTDSDLQFLQKIGTLDSIYSKTLNEYREIYIQLPADYNPAEDKKYPVVYVLDGEVFLPTVTNVLRFYSGGFIPEMVVVGISNDKNRMRDLTTSTVTEMYGMPFKQKNGEAANFSNFLETELIPFVEKKYLVTNFRTLIGHSYAGLFTLYSLVHQPHLFSNYLAIDPSLDWDHQKLLKEAKDKITSTDFKGKSLFMSLGGQVHMQKPNMPLEEVKKDSTDFTLFARSNLAFSELLNNSKQNELSFEWKFYPRDLHGTIAVPSIMDGLISVFQWYQMEHIDAYNTPTTTVEELTKVLRYRQNKLQTYFGYSVPPLPYFLLYIQGDMNMDMDQMDKAKMYFDFAIEYYPENVNAYSALATYYVRNNDKRNAIKFFTQALEISGDDSYKKRIEELKKE